MANLMNIYFFSVANFLEKTIYDGMPMINITKKTIIRWSREKEQIHCRGIFFPPDRILLMGVFMIINDRSTSATSRKEGCREPHRSVHLYLPLQFFTIVSLTYKLVISILISINDQNQCLIETESESEIKQEHQNTWKGR